MSTVTDQEEADIIAPRAGHPPASAPVPGHPDDDQATRFTALYRRHSVRVYGYARLRSTPDVAEEAVADTFLTAWRLRDRIPDDPLPWLLVIARNALANRRRSTTRSTRLTVAMSSVHHLAADPPAAEDVAVDRAALLDALASLTDDEREAVLLTAWDGLAQSDAALVAGCSTRTMASRLRRARRFLGHALAAPPASGSIPRSPEAAASHTPHPTEDPS